MLRGWADLVRDAVLVNYSSLGSDPAALRRT